MVHTLCKIHIELGEWKLPYMGPTEKVAEEFTIFGKTLQPMVLLSTTESCGEHGKWTIA